MTGITLAADNGVMHAFKTVPVIGFGRFVTKCGRVVSGQGIDLTRYRPSPIDRPCRRCAALRPGDVPTLEQI